MAGGEKFWASEMARPKRAFRWFLTLQGADTGLKLETYAIKTVKKPSFVVSETPHQYVGHTFHFPGRITWNTLDVTFVDPLQPDHTTILHNMLAKAGWKEPVTEQAAQKSFSKLKWKNAIGEIYITQIDADGLPIEKWGLVNSFFTSVDFGQLDYSSEELVINSVTIRYDWAQLQTAGGTPAVDTSVRTS